MSTRIIYKEKLWGLIACHHRTAKYLTFEECTIFELLSSVISSRINSILANQTAVVQNKQYELSSLCIRNLATFSDLSDGLTSNTGLIKQILKADFIVITMAGKYHADANTLNESNITGIVSWLQSISPNNVVHTPSLASAYPAAKAFADVASGMLALPVNAYQDSYILAFRKECIQLVNWGGNPSETISFSGNTYNPRHSFKLWQETVRYSSIPWTEEEYKVAEDFKNLVVEQALRSLTTRLEQKVEERTAELQQSNDRLNSMHKELKEITFLTTHRLQEGIRRIRFMTGMLPSDNNESRLKRMNEISAISEKMQHLIIELENESKM
jgi:light-regulated signal transduction histidine kinase (bacteriophytochrome)